MIDLYLKSNIVVVLAISAALDFAVGEILRVTLELAQFEARLVLYSKNAEILNPTEDR